MEPNRLRYKSNDQLSSPDTIKLITSLPKPPAANSCNMKAQRLSWPPKVTSTNCSSSEQLPNSGVIKAKNGLKMQSSHAFKNGDFVKKQPKPLFESRKFFKIQQTTHQGYNESNLIKPGKTPHIPSNIIVVPSLPFMKIPQNKSKGNNVRILPPNHPAPESSSIFKQPLNFLLPQAMHISKQSPSNLAEANSVSLQTQNALQSNTAIKLKRPSANSTFSNVGTPETHKQGSDVLHAPNMYTLQVSKQTVVQNLDHPLTFNEITADLRTHCAASGNWRTSCTQPSWNSLLVNDNSENAVKEEQSVNIGDGLNIKCEETVGLHEHVEKVKVEFKEENDNISCTESTENGTLPVINIFKAEIDDTTEEYSGDKYQLEYIKDEAFQEINQIKPEIDLTEEGSNDVEYRRDKTEFRNRGLILSKQYKFNKRSNHQKYNNLQHMKHLNLTNKVNITEDKTNFTCNICKKIYVRSHMHMEEKQITCCHKCCKKKFKQLCISTITKMTNCQNVEYGCKKCDKICKSKGNMYAHMNTHINTRLYKCKPCKISFKTGHDYAQHRKMHLHPQICKICGQKFIRKSYLVIHMKTHKVHKCSECGEHFESKSKLTNHVRIHKKDRTKRNDCVNSKRGTKSTIKTKPDQTKHLCQQCGKLFAYERSLKTHMVCHTGKKPYECKLCHKFYRSSSNLRNHEITHLKKIVYLCELCGKSFIKQECVKRHLKAHSEERPFPCNQCEKRFKRQDQLKAHLVSHSGARPYKCHLCGKGLSSNAGLQNHLQTKYIH